MSVKWESNKSSESLRISKRNSFQFSSTLSSKPSRIRSSLKSSLFFSRKSLITLARRISSLALWATPTSFYTKSWATTDTFILQLKLKLSRLISTDLRIYMESRSTLPRTNKPSRSSCLLTRQSGAVLSELLCYLLYYVFYIREKSWFCWIWKSKIQYWRDQFI